MELKEKIEATKVEEQQAQRKGDLEPGAELRYGTLTQLQKELEQANTKLAELQKDQKMLKEEVDAKDVAEVVAKWTGIPVSKMPEGDIQKLLKMEDRLKARVVGQRARSTRFPTPSAAPAPGCRIRTALSGRLFSSVPPASARRRSAVPWRNSCSMTNRQWFASICPSSWKSIPSRG